MRDYEKFYMEVETISADVSALINVLDMYYKTFLCSGNDGERGDYRKFGDWLYIINCYADGIMEDIKEMLKRNM